MRKKGRYITKGALIVGGITALGDIFIQWLEHRERSEPFTWDSYNGTRTLRNGMIGVGVGGGLGYLAYESQRIEEAKTPFHTDGYLKKVLTGEYLKKDPELFEKVLKKREIVKKRLEGHFRSGLVSPPEDAGSFYKRTAIRSNYDLDIILPFQRNFYPTLKDMYYDVFETIGSSFSRHAEVTKQRKSIGLTFNVNDEEIHFDIVPGRETSNYVVGKRLNLYVRPNWVWQRGTSAKTSVGIDKNLVVNKPEARRVIKLLKVYRDRNGLSLPKTIIDQCVVAALSNQNYGISKSVTDNLLNSMYHIAKKLENEIIVDVSNTNNNLSGNMSSWQKSYIADLLRKDVNRIEKNPHYIKEIFEL